MKKLIIILVCIFAFYAKAEERYIIEFEAKQSHFTLDIGTHIKDKFNTLVFEIPVDKKFYDSLKVGDILAEEFRTASLVIKGSFGKWKIIVKDKRIAK